MVRICFGRTRYDDGDAVRCVFSTDADDDDDVSAGGQHTCAVDTDDVIYCWGNNADGQVDLFVRVQG
eukprot:3688957-Rhodomonas_salina.1